MSRMRLPNRRPSEVINLELGGNRFSVGISRFPDAKVAEAFIASEKPGSMLEALARDAPILASFALQYGANVEALRAAMTRDQDGAATTVIGAALDAIGGEP